MTLLETFSKRLTQLMDTEKVSVRKLSIKTQISRRSIRLYMLGLCLPRYDSLAKIADYFEVSTDYLLGKDAECFDSFTTVCEIHEIPQHFVTCLQALMNENRFSQGELSRRLHMKQTSVSKWIRMRTMLETDALAALSDIFDCKVDYLINREKKQ